MVEVCAFGQRLRAAPLQVEEGGVTSVAFGPDGTLAAGYARGRRIGGVVLLDADPVSWRAKAAHVANRNFTWEEWSHYFPAVSYRRTVPSLPWPHDLPEAQLKHAVSFEKEQPERSGAS